ncbi:hypothetical protein [Maridesulfovibrio sp. FT414]|uniref:hypothetical protein n=1 Tax=Maridesulfovibrio sp. FT414 TaxID=2979469 RepID=UPI003D804C95
MWGIYSALKAAFHRKRTCPNCGTVNIIKYGDKLKTVTCSKCGTKLPAPREQI